MEFRYTQRRVPRGARADAEDAGNLYLLKNVPLLHATYQVRLLAYRARKEGRHLVLVLPPGSRMGASLKRLKRETHGTIRLRGSEA